MNVSPAEFPKIVLLYEEILNIFATAGSFLLDKF